MAKKKRRQAQSVRVGPPIDTKIGSFCASHGYIDAANGSQEYRAYVVKVWGKQYLRFYERGREDARKYRKDMS